MPDDEMPMPGAKSVVRKRQAWGQRSRNGCGTCRSRRIKCDEQQPACLRCHSTGRVCDGYRAEAVDRQQSTAMSRAASPSPYSMASLNLAAVLPHDSKERHHFRFFEQYTAMEFSGYFDNDLWTRLILQMSRTQPAVRHAVVTLGSLHENLQACDDVQVPVTTIYSLQHYNKAVLHLQRQLTSSQQSIGVTLTCCILFVCFETLQRDYVTALTQLKKGLNILCSWKYSHTGTGTTLLSPEGRFIKENLLPLYLHLDVQATTVIENRGLGFPSNIRKSTGDSKLPLRFTSTHEARYWLDVLLYSMYDTIVKPTNPDPDHLAQLDDMTRDWATAFSTYVNNQLDLNALNTSDVRAGTILKIYHTVAIIMIGTRLSGDDALHESFYSSFKEITTLCKSLIRSPNTSAPRRSTFRFSLDMGVVPPLFYVAINCRDIVIRTEAIALLAAEPRREGIWDGRMAAEVAREHADVKYSNMGLVE
ncbi:hypothetical protein V502_01399 [Pseudogymnoascus sp. VKM F-4520 (FW-2644)]|nr:hypothetical protein V502_01399 [Pseudogymnoascus sp. VKM F-4520 (FW-2644)]